MIKYTPKVLVDNHNVSKTHPLVELFWLAGGLLLLTGVIFLSLGLMTDWAVSKTSPEIEALFADSIIENFDAQPSPELSRQLDKIVDNLPNDSILKQYDFKVYLSKGDVVNALALPGGNIVVYSGLLDVIESENELAMVLSHELGHFASRDHLRGVGRGLCIVVISTFLFGVDSEASELISNATMSFQAQYSQDQEEVADLFALDLLVQTYGHAGGATDFFERVSTHTDQDYRFLSTHPTPESRVEKLNLRIKQRNYPIDDVKLYQFE
ncbi:M48 family metallopeptidase [Vibrio algarum]|uniref:M48 family metallopeptidase n=1 Tax=Vibrio algarum TaxID=3020714 RepID=A0ABT4YUY1_9VIBR|nr:M48 family metallopeptidase [Vibrio sp. KJ40-1]MDB1124813.1 M48 family metallopeptidase [Vibrio sp. KJ40-1]